MTATIPAPTRFAVIITNYNYQNFVVEAVQSVLNQKRSAHQIIVVEDGSTDGSVDVLREAFEGDARVKLLFGENGGQLSAFRRGFAEVCTDVVCFLDSDDRWAPDYLEKLGQLFDRRPDIDFVFSDMQMFGNETKKLAFADQAVDLGYTAVSTYMERSWYGAPTSALALRISMVRQCLNLPVQFDETWRICADCVLVFGTSLLCGRKYFLPTGSVGYRIHSKNGWGLIQPLHKTFVLNLHLRALINYFASNNGIDRSCWTLLMREFDTKPEPIHAETVRYARLAMRGDGSYLKRLKLSLNIRFWRWRKRSMATKFSD
jgi:glycosyltransferase involved in cell wall biosynthesis